MKSVIVLTLMLCTQFACAQNNSVNTQFESKRNLGIYRSYETSEIIQSAENSVNLKSYCFKSGEYNEETICFNNSSIDMIGYNETKIAYIQKIPCSNESCSNIFLFRVQDLEKNKFLVDKVLTINEESDDANAVIHLNEQLIENTLYSNRINPLNQPVQFYKFDKKGQIKIDFSTKTSELVANYGQRDGMIQILKNIVVRDKNKVVFFQKMDKSTFCQSCVNGMIKLEPLGYIKLKELDYEILVIGFLEPIVLSPYNLHLQLIAIPSKQNR